MKIVRPVTIGENQFWSSNILEDDYAVWDSSTTYSIYARVIVSTTDYHKVFESVVGSNVGFNPVTDNGTKWLLVGSTNRWRMFDGSPSEQSSRASQITVSLAPAEYADSVALMNISAASVTITQTDPTDGLVYNQTYSLVSSSAIQDWYAYFFTPIARVPDFAVTDLLPYPTATIAVTLDDIGAQVLCGECVIGLSREIGDTQYGASVGIVDYSIKQADVWGNYSITERAFAKRGEFTVWVEAEAVTELQHILASYRATPAVYVGSDFYASTLIYGFYKDFSIDIATPSYSVCTIQVEGLV